MYAPFPIDTGSDSYNGTKQCEEMVSVSKNMEHIAAFLDSYDLLRTVFKASKSTKTYSAVSQLYQTMVVMFTHRALVIPDKPGENDTYRFEISQQMVYACSDARPIFGGGNGLQIDMEWLAHVANFWKYHLTRREENTLFEAFSSLADYVRPRAWQGRLDTGVPRIGKAWKGSYGGSESSRMFNLVY